MDREGDGGVESVADAPVPGQERGLTSSPAGGSSDGTPGSGWWWRLEESSNGRAVLSALVALLVLVVLVLLMPASEIKARLVPTAAPLANALGLDQGWAVFAPDPRAVSLYMEARIERADGTVAVRPVPIQRGLAEYWEFRWQRWSEQLLGNDAAQAQWVTYARWVAERERSTGAPPVRVTLVSLSARTRPPGPGPARDQWVERPFFSIPVEPS